MTPEEADGTLTAPRGALSKDSRSGTPQ